jgi:hypothetical protein
VRIGDDREPEIPAWAERQLQAREGWGARHRLSLAPQRFLKSKGGRAKAVWYVPARCEGFEAPEPPPPQ